MRPLHRLFAAIATTLLLHSVPVLAKAPATVELVQAPAWLERDGRTLPLSPGMELRNGDLVRTGEGARAYLMLAEGSRVKLGESARFNLHTKSMRPEKAFRAALDVLTGAFRFTTGAIKKTLPRDVAIRVGTATVGIRGTDIWGKTDKDGELVALIEGRIEITRAGQTTDMAQPMSYYDAPRGQQASVKALDAETFARLARQTEIIATDGANGAKGKWKIIAGSAGSQADALALYDQVREAGFAARIRPIAADSDSPRYEVVVRGFATAAAAEAAAARLKAATEPDTQLRPKVAR